MAEDSGFPIRNNPAVPPIRLDSWKEIANYFSRSVRTVQRWEKELGLPVHRLAGKKRDIVYAIPADLDEWWAAHSSQLSHDHDQEAHEAAPENDFRAEEPIGVPQEIHAEPQASTRRQRILRVAAVGLALAAVVLAVWVALPLRVLPPANFVIQGKDLIALDAKKKELWRYSFLMPIAFPERSRDRQMGKILVSEDFDGDGKTELLIVINTWQPGQPNKLYCFDHRGKLLWEYAHTRAVRYGQGPMLPPFHAKFFLLTRSADSNSPAHIWLISQHDRWFASVVTKLDARGQPLGEFWHPGHFGAIAEAKLDGRRVILVGGTHNEFFSATLAALDYENPSGSAPASNPEYRCLDCPAGHPLAFALFTRTSISKALSSRGMTADIQVRADGQLEVTTDSGWFENSNHAGENYTFDSQFRLVSAETLDSYSETHARLQAKRLLRGPLDRKAEAVRLLAGVHICDGTQFLPYATEKEVKSEINVAFVLNPRTLLRPR